MSETPGGPGWWQASDGKWYPPELHPDATAAGFPPPTSGPPGVPPAGPPSNAPVVPEGFPAVTPVGDPFADDARGRRRWVAIAIVVALLAVGGIVAATIAVLLGGDDEVTEVTAPATTVVPDPGGTTPPTEPPPGTDAPVTTDAPDTTEPSDTTVTPTTDAPATTTPPTDPGEATCRSLGVDTFGDVQVELTFTNPLGDVDDLQVAYALADRNGVRFGDSTAYVERAAANERFRISDDSLEDLPPDVDEDEVTCTILVIEEGFGFGDTEPPGADAACEFIEIDSFDDIQIRVSATSPFGETVDIEIIAALRGPDGVRFGTTSAFANRVAPGESVRISHDTITELPDWVNEDEFTCEVIGISSFG